MGEALESSKHGKFSLCGSEEMTLREIMNALERQAGRDEGAVRGPLIPTFDYFWDFFVGTTSDKNMSRMAHFYEENPIHSSDHHSN